MDKIQSAEHAQFWLRKAAARRAIDEARRRRRRPQIALEEVAEPAAEAGTPDPLLDSLSAALCAAALAQQFKFNLDHLAAKASNAVDVSLNGPTLQFAAKFLDGGEPDEAAVKKLIAGLEGIYVKSFEFRNPGEWSQADLDQVRAQLRAPEWSRMIGAKSAQDGEAVDVFLHMENKKVTGVAILAVEPKELTVVNIVGPIDLIALSQLGGHFGVPKLDKKKEP